MFLWAPFLSYVIIMGITPGPNNITSMNNAAKFGFRRSIGFNFGVLAGFFVVLILCAVFTSVLYSIVPKVMLPMKVLCAAYMLYLIMKTLLPQKAHDVRKSGASFLAGMVLQLINAKAIVVGITAMSAYILPHWTPRVSLLFCFGMAVNAFACTILWSLFGSVFSRLFEKHKMALNIIMSVLLLYCGVSLFL
jgi:threonine/homoserine/homoserine lactone efflux protein